MIIVHNNTHRPTYLYISGTICYNIYNISIVPVLLRVSSIGMLRYVCMTLYWLLLSLLVSYATCWRNVFNYSPIQS